MTEFVASNGIKIVRNESGLLCPAANKWDDLLPESEVAFREFFLHERDVELGRWRSKEYSEYVVYPYPSGRIYVVNESAPGSSGESFTRGEFSDTAAYYTARKVALEYFAAHPVSKPWHDAQPGEVWALTVLGKESAWSLGDSASVWSEASTGRTLESAPTSPAITAGRRIWPEVTQ